MEDYAAKMLLKTDAALREYVSGHAQYREAAVLAALDELRRRAQPAPEEAALRPGLELAAAAQRTLDEAAEHLQATTIGTATGNEAAAGPALYSPVTIVLFSMLTLLIGGVLMCMNLYRLGKKSAMLGLALFIVAYSLLGSEVVSWVLLQGGFNLMWGVLLLNLSAALVYVLWFWPRYVGTTPFRSRSVLGPALVCMLILWGSQKLTPYLLQKQPKEVRQQLERMMQR